MFRTDRFALLTAAPMIDEPGAGPAPAPVESAPAAPSEPTFDSVAKAMFDTVQKEMEAPAAETTAASPPPVAPPVAEAPLATPTFAPPPAPAAPAPDQMQMQLLQQMQQTQAQLLERMQQAQPAPRADLPKPAGPPTVKEIMRSYRPPERAAGEPDDAYAVRNQAAVLDHMNQANASWLQEQSKSIARETVETYQRQIQQQSYVQQAERTLQSELDQAVQTAGYPAGSPQAGFLRATLEAEVRHGLTTGRFNGHTDQSFKAGLRSWVTEAKRLMAPPPPAPGARPNLQVVDAPISAGGGTAAPANPQSTAPAAPRSFEEAMGNAFGQWKRA